MSCVPTPHISANLEEIAKTVLMPGDPLRAKYIAENFLDNIKCFNSVRNMLGYTGYYKGKRISVMGGGMGMPSMGIYSYELFNFYDVDNIVRIGSAGAISEDINLGEIVIGMGACTDSNYFSQYNLNGMFSCIGNYELIKKAENTANKLDMKLKIGNIISSDVFYSDSENLKNWGKLGVLAVEMEAAALYMNASRHNKNALCILTISDCLFKSISISSEERETGFSNMINLALEMFNN